MGNLLKFPKIKNNYINIFLKIILFLFILLTVISSLFLINNNFNKINESENQIYNEKLSYFDSNELGFVFYYPSYLKVETDENNPKQLFVYPKINKDPLTAIIITKISDNDIEDSENIKSNKDIASTNISTTKEVGNLVLLENWTLIEDINSDKKIRIGYLIEENKGAKPLIKEFDEIVNSISFK